VSADPQQATVVEPVALEGLARLRNWRSYRVRAEHIRDYGILVVFAAMFIFLTFKSPVFLTKDNLLNLLYSNSAVGIAACAVTVVVIGGNFDLSLGGIYIFSALLAAWTAVHWNIWLAFPVAFGAAIAMGLVNGLLVTKLRVNAFLATLASGLVFFGMDKLVSGGTAIYVGTASGGSEHDGNIWTFLGQNKLRGLPPPLDHGVQYPVIIFVAVAIILQILLSRTVFGRHVYGVGGNRDAARLSGLKVDRIIITTFVIAGVAAGLAGLLDYSALAQGSPGDPTSQNLALAAIAGVALGGTSIFGGVGSIWRTVIGVLMLGLITNGFNLLGVRDFYQDIVRGSLIVVAVAIGSLVVERR
jgi:ribose transport system permease protein